MAKTRSIKNYKGKSLYYFFNDKLVRLVDTDAVGDRVMVYEFDDHENHIYRLSEFKKYREQAYTLPEVCDMLNRSYWILYRKIKNEITWIGTLATYGNSWTRHYFSKQDILDLHEYLASIDPRGPDHPRAAGRRNYPTPKNKLVKRDDLPTREQLLAMLNSNEVYYVKNEETGEFEPVFKPRW